MYLVFLRILPKIKFISLILTKQKSGGSWDVVPPSTAIQEVSFIMYPTSITEVEYEEVPEYEISKLLSDIGGTAGLILGISVSTILAYIDKLVVYIIPKFFSSWTLRGDVC